MDTQQRVRFAAVECVAIFADEYPTVFQRMYSRTVVPAMIAVFGEGSCDKVKGHAAAAMCNFANPESCSSTALEPHMDGLLSQLCALLTAPGSSLATQEQALMAVSRIAEVAEADFGKYYDVFMPGAKGLVANATGKEQVDLRGKAMEAISIMGEAVGAEKFATDGKEVLELMLKLKGETAACGLDMYTAGACARTCWVLGDACAPYLPHLIPALIETMQREVEFAFCQADDDAAGEGADVSEAGVVNTTVHVRGMGLQRVSLNVSALQDKQDACRTLNDYADNLGGALFAPYVEAAATAAIPLITDKISHDVRGSAAMLLPKLLGASSAFLRDQGQPQDYAQTMLQIGIKQVRARVRTVVAAVLVATSAMGTSCTGCNVCFLSLSPSLSLSLFLSLPLSFDFVSKAYINTDMKHMQSQNMCVCARARARRCSRRLTRRRTTRRG